MQGKGRVQSDSEYQWLSPDESVRIPYSREWGPLLQLASEWDLAVSGEALGYVEGLGLGQQLIPLCQVSLVCYQGMHWKAGHVCPSQGVWSTA